MISDNITPQQWQALRVDNTLKKRASEMTHNAADRMNELIAHSMVNNSDEIMTELRNAAATHMILNRLDSQLASNNVNTKPVHREALAWAMQQSLGQNAQRDGAYNKVMQTIELDPAKSYDLTDDVRGALSKDFSQVAMAQAAG